MASESLSVNLTTPQRNCLLAILRAHPDVYEVRGAAQLPRRLCEAGLARELEGQKPMRHFQLTEQGLARATRLANLRGTDYLEAVLAAELAHSPSPSGTALHATAGTGQRVAIANWPFPHSAHAWSIAATTGDQA